MKILVICQYYYPEPFRITDICEEFVKRGHKVTVITGTPNYPMGRIYEGYRFGKKRDEVINGVNVHRCFTIGRRQGAFYRFLNYYSYAISSTNYVKRLKAEYDVVFVNQLSPVMMANAGITYKKKHKKKMILYCLDLWPESLVAGGINKHSVVYKYFHRYSEKIYSQADRTLVSSQSFIKYFLDEFNITDAEYLPQYAEEIFSPETCQKEPNGNIDLMFAGNVGVAQSVDTIIRAAALTLDIPNLRWHIVGDGSELRKVKQLAKEIHADSVIFHGRQPLDLMPKFYAMADVMLVSLIRDNSLSATLPGKIQTYMATGKPIIAAADGETKHIISEAKCGYCVGAEDYVELEKVARSLCAQNDIRELSNNAKQYFITKFSKLRFFDVLCGRLEEVKENLHS